jgi:hypothetical protein
VWFENVFLHDLLGRAVGSEAIDAVEAQHAERIKEITPVLEAQYGGGATAAVLDLDGAVYLSNGPPRSGDDG